MGNERSEFSGLGLFFGFCAGMPCSLLGTFLLVGPGLAYELALGIAIGLIAIYSADVGFGVGFELGFGLFTGLAVALNSGLTSGKGLMLTLSLMIGLSLTLVLLFKMSELCVEKISRRIIRWQLSRNR